MPRRLKTHFVWLILWFSIIALAAGLINSFLSLRWLWTFLIAINTATLFLFGWDKLSAGQKIDRVPELILHFSVLCGGGIGALLGMNLFHHKTKKFSFQVVVVLIILMQLSLLFYFFRNLLIK